jgi:hypothetical protein
MIPGTETGNGPPTLTDNNQAIYDPATGTTWPVDANPAATLVATYTPAQLQTMLGMTVCNGVGTPSNAPNCINPDGSMNWPSAQQFVWALNHIKYLDLTGWTLPPFNNIGCVGQACADPTDNPLAYLYYGQNELGWTTGNPALVTPQPTAANNPFNDIQMTYYWSCAAEDDQLMAASPCDYATMTVPAPGFAWDYALSNGYLSTDHSGLNPSGIDYVGQDFFVTAYYAVPEPPSWVVLLTGLAALASTLLAGRTGPVTDNIAKPSTLPPDCPRRAVRIAASIRALEGQWEPQAPAHTSSGAEPARTPQKPSPAPTHPSATSAPGRPPPKAASTSSCSPAPANTSCRFSTAPTPTSTAAS